MVLGRREFIASSAAASLALNCRRREFPFDGALQGPSLDLGHLARDGALPQPERFQPVDVLIVGGGIAGLSAAWHLKRRGFHDFLLLELEAEVGGTSRSGRNGVSEYPLAAHYVPAPTKDVGALVELLHEAGVVEGVDAKGEPIFAEQHLVRSPDERIFHAGQWWEGLYLHAGESAEDVRQYRTFFKEVDAWVAFRDAKGRPAFTLPRSRGSDAPEVRALDRLSFSQWLDARGLIGERLRWMLDYAVRDDFGARLDTCSAWAGLFYFAARKQGPGEESRPLLTWPEGNGFLVKHLRARCNEHLRTSRAVFRVEPERGGIQVQAWNAASNQAEGYRARRVIFAGSVAMAGRVIAPLRAARGDRHFGQFLASPWLVANLTLRDRPKERGFPLAWDNVIRNSPGLGYVVATHQGLRDHGPTVWTYYHAFTGPDIPAEWRRMAGLDWGKCARMILEDLSRPHPNLVDLITRLDVNRWAHAMLRPRPGLLWGEDLPLARQPFQGIHFAHSDLSGFALFEEAQDHGIRAAEEILKALR